MFQVQISKFSEAYLLSDENAIGYTVYVVYTCDAYYGASNVLPFRILFSRRNDPLEALFRL